LDRDDRLVGAAVGAVSVSTLDRLLQEGLDLYQSGLVDHAVAVWTEAVHVQPDDPRARDYLRQAGVSVDETESPVPMHGHGTRAELEQLLAERRYEEALELLFEARRQNPTAPDISRGIQLLKQRLVRRYLHQIGNLDHVPKLAIAEAEVGGLKLEEEERELLRLVDGISSFGDIAHESRLGRFETFRIFAKLVSEQVITQATEDREEEGDVAAPATAVTMVAELPDAAEAGPTPAEMSGETPLSSPSLTPHRRRVWPLLLGLGVVGAGGAVYFFLGQEQRAVPPEATAAAPAAAAAAPPALAPPPQPEPAPAPQPVEPQPVAAAPEPAAEEPPIEIEPPASPASPSRPAAKPRPPARAAAVRRADTPAKADEAPPTAAPAESPPATAAPTPEPPPPTQNPTENPNQNQNQNQPQTPTPTPPPSPPARLDARASVALESVAGALTRSEVDRALARITPSFHACYTSAASRAQKNAAATIHLAFVVDETGLAQAPEAGPAPLPGLSDCLRDSLRQLRTQLAPDVGVVRVAAHVTFSPLGP